MFGHKTGPVSNYPVDALVTRPVRYEPTVVDLRISRGTVWQVVRSLFCFQGVPQGPDVRLAGRRGLVVRIWDKRCRPRAGNLSFPELVRAPVEPLENCIASTSIFVLPRYKEPTVDA